MYYSYCRIIIYRKFLDYKKNKNKKRKLYEILNILYNNSSRRAVYIDINNYSGGGALINYARNRGIIKIPTNILEDDYLNICTISKAEASH